MSLFKYRADILPVAIFASIFVVDLLVFFFVPNPWIAISWYVLALPPKVAVCCWNHHHQHVPTFKSVLLNRALELIYTFQTGITTNAWVLHHNLGHHVNYLDQTKDESGWTRKDGTTMGELEYTIKLALSGYFTAYKVGRNHPKYQQSFLTMGTLSLIIVSLALWHNWLYALFALIIPMSVGYIATCWHTYSHHAGLHTDDHYEASYNVMHKWYNIITGNLGYHTAHHVKQAVHWSKLPELHDSIESKIPAELYRLPPWPIRLLPAE